MHLAAVVVASIMLASVQPAPAENYCAETQAHAETPLPDYLAYYRSVAAAKPDETLYIRGEKELQAGSPTRWSSRASSTTRAGRMS